jgi:hypothetical protein
MTQVSEIESGDVSALSWQIHIYSSLQNKSGSQKGFQLFVVPFGYKLTINYYANQNTAIETFKVAEPEPVQSLGQRYLRIRMIDIIS